jgi:hypothetical protein
MDHTFQKLVPESIKTPNNSKTAKTRAITDEYYEIIQTDVKKAIKNAKNRKISGIDE